VEETERNNCTSCEWPCSTCDKSPDSCTACVPGYNLFKNKPACYEVVYWPFPFVFTGIIFFILVCCSECFTKRQSRFKEAIVALVSLPEAAAWGTLFGFYYYKIGPALSTLLAAGAIALYILLNFIHMIVHPRKMIPKTLATY